MFNLTQSHFALVVYLFAINIITFIVFCVDKKRAVGGRWRIREVTLLTLSLLGGSIGGMLAMKIARHKTQVYYFKYGLPIMLVVDCLVIGYMIQIGLL